MFASLNGALKGWRTVIVGLAIACAPSALTYLGSVDWTHYVGPNAALFISGLASVAMRCFTNTPVGRA